MIDPSNPQSPLIILPIDKFQDNYAIVCRKLYVRELKEELAKSATFKIITSKSEEVIVAEINDYCEREGIVVYVDDENGKCKNQPSKVSRMYASIKLHKQKVQWRQIAGGSNVPTTPISKVVSRALQLVIKDLHVVYSNMVSTHTGILINECPILKNADTLVDHLNWLNVLSARKVVNLEDGVVAALDFTRLYPSITHHDLKRVLRKIIRYLFFVRSVKMKQKGIKRQPNIIMKIHPSSDEAKWESKEEQYVGVEDLVISASQLCKFVDFVVDNSSKALSL